MDITEFILDLIPASVVVHTAAEYRLVYTNSQFQKTFKGSREDFLGVHAITLVAPEQQHLLAGDWKAPIDREDGSQREQFRLFRRRDDTEFIGWWRNTFATHPEHGRLVISIIFEYYDEEAESEFVSNFFARRNEALRSKISAHLAEELNSALSSLVLVMGSDSTVGTSSEQVSKSVEHVKRISERFMRIGLGSAEATEILRYVEKESPLPSVKDLTLLIVDDDELFLELLSESLVNHVRKVSAASNFDAAKKLFNESNFHVALIDLRLGDEDGRDLANELLQKSSTTVVIFMTGYAHAQVIVEASHSARVLKKPFSIEQLLATISELAIEKR